MSIKQFRRLGQDTPYTLCVFLPAVRKAFEVCCGVLNSGRHLEAGGFLIGTKNDLKRQVHILDSCEAQRAEASPTHLRISVDDWEYADKYLDTISTSERKYQIYGWYHSHPGYGVFLSNTDKFTVNNFFNKPWNVSLVIDPVKHSFGFFTSLHGRTQRILEFAVIPGSRLSEGKSLNVQIINRRWRYFESQLAFDVSLDETKSLLPQIRPLFLTSGTKLMVGGVGDRGLRSIDPSKTPADLSIKQGDKLSLF